MNIVDFSPLPALAGGILIGTATGLALLMNGKIAGISGVFGRILRAVPGDTGWRVWFVLGLIAGGAATFALYPPADAFVPVASTGQMALAGLLIGFGARLSGGCTSGHGICEISRGSIRGVVGTATFTVVGAITVYILNHVVGLR